LSEAGLQGTHLQSAQFQGANLDKAQLQGAHLAGAQLQGATLRRAKIQGADLGWAELEGGTQLQGADLTGAEVWLVNFPVDLANQSPVPLGVADLDMAPPTADHKAKLKEELNAKISDGELLTSLLDRLNPILRNYPPKWDDKDSWIEYVSQAKEPSPDELGQFLADITCKDPEGNIAIAMAERAEHFSQDDGKRRYAKPLAIALLNEKCDGAKALTDEIRAILKNMGSARP
jgi:uncharacterized protein YjbI with pentapeptide repeats